MDRAQVIEHVREALLRERQVSALFLTGSLARGEGDEHSDVDLLAIVTSDAVPDVCERWLAVRPTLFPVVHETRRDWGAATLFHQITPDWVRLDLTIADATALDGRSRSTATPLFDRDGCADRLPERLPLSEVSPQTALHTVPEFFRVLALLPVALGREDHALGASGSTLLRSMLIEGLRELVTVEDRGGALSLRRLLPAEHYAVVAEVPPIAATRESVLAVHRYCAQHFVDAGRQLCRRAGTPWPADLVAAVATRTEPYLGPWRDGVADA